MKTIVAIAALLLFWSTAQAQLNSTNALISRSVSGQFLAFSRKGDVPSRFAIANTNSISLEPSLLVVSCERIKQALNHQLDATAPYQGKIYLHLHSAHNANAQVSIVAENSARGWIYHVDLPDSLEQTAFLQAIVQALLMEMANRHADSRLAEIPLWLTQGLSRQLLATEKSELLLLPPRLVENGVNISRLLVDGRRQNPIEQAQQTLRAHAPLTFEQLSWPTVESMSVEDAEVFRSTAQLFVNQLLLLNGGPACVRAMLDILPRRYNWQFAFFNGFRSHFQSQLDVEKWWELQIVQFTGRDLMQTWTPEESWRKLDEIILSPLNVRKTAAELPLRTQVSLQSVIRDVDLLSQTQILRRKLVDLDFLRLRAAPGLVSLIDDYREVIRAYLQRPALTTSLLPVRKLARKNSAIDETLRQLDELDARRESLRPRPGNHVMETAKTGSF